MRALVVLAALAGGCAPHLPLRALVAVDASALAGKTLESRRDGRADALDAIRAGLAMWDPAGGRFVLSQDLGTDAREATRVLRLEVGPDDGEVLGKYDEASGRLFLATAWWADADANTFPYAERLLCDVVAHEVGHALGLDHLVGADAVMNAYAGPRTKLSAGDLAAAGGL